MDIISSPLLSLSPAPRRRSSFLRSSPFFFLPAMDLRYLARSSSWLYIREDIADTSMTRFLVENRLRESTSFPRDAKANRASVTFIASSKDLRLPRVVKKKKKRDIRQLPPVYYFHNDSIGARGVVYCSTNELSNWSVSERRRRENSAIIYLSEAEISSFTYKKS